MMKKSLQEKLQALCDRYDEIGSMLGAQEIISNQEKFKSLSMEYAQLEDVTQAYKRYDKLLKDIKAAEEMLTSESDADMREMLEEEIKSGNEQVGQLTNELQILLLPKDPDDTSNVYLEIRAGTGGDEAAIFSGDLYRMYFRYAEQNGWQVEVMNVSEGEHGGYKEIIVRIKGQNVYSKLKFESGAHRVQRVPETESQGRIHTSACTVAVMPEVKEVEEININPADLKVDTFRASGAGGQHVNKTDSAIRITHLPTGVVVECQDERSQHKNRARAMSILQARLMAAEKAKQDADIAQTRRNLVGSGDRSERIRTYNYPQGRVTDHRINLTLYKLENIMEGALGHIIEPLVQEHQTDMLTALSDE